MAEKATDLSSPPSREVAYDGESAKAPFPIGVLLLGAHAVMPDSQHLAQRIEEVRHGSPFGLCTFRHLGPKLLEKQQ